MQNLKTVLYETIHRHEKTVAQLADETGISTNYLYRAGLPLDESGVKFPVDYVIPLMRATNNYGVLKHLANVSGFILIKAPKANLTQLDKNKLINEYQKTAVDSLHKLMRFFESPDQGSYNEVTNALHDVMEKSASAKEYVEKEYQGQYELSLDN